VVERRDRERSGLVLVADDDVVTQHVLRALVGRLGFHADVATSGESVLARWERGGIDAILLDYRLAGTDGVAVAREIRQREATEGRARTPLVAVTASTAPADRTRCLAAGMDAFLVKPVDVDDLAVVLDRLLGRRRVASGT
jgi:CheY-like chemotaxis protein